MLENGWIIVPRDVLNSEWSDDCGTMWVYVYMIMRANIADSRWHGVDVPRGSFVSSYESLSKETGLTVRQLRTVINRLETTGKVTRSKYPQYTVFTVVGYDKMQSPTSKTTAERQAADKVTTSKRQQNKEEKETNELNNIILSEKSDPNTKIFSLKETIDSIYSLYPHKVGKAKGIEYAVAYLTKGRRFAGIGSVRFNHEELIGAVRQYANECDEKGTEMQYIKHFDSFMSKPVVDYVEKAKEDGYEEFMERKYGNEWKRIKFLYE